MTKFFFSASLLAMITQTNFENEILIECTNTKSLAKKFSKILAFEYFGYENAGFDVFFDADSESPRMT